MSIVEILMRSISGYIFIIPGIILYFGALRKSAKRQTPLHITTAFIFCYYLIGILTMTGIGKLKAFDPTLVLVPFRDMISGPIDTMLNIILFVPLIRESSSCEIFLLRLIFRTLCASFISSSSAVSQTNASINVSPFLAPLFYTQSCLCSILFIFLYLSSFFR